MNVDTNHLVAALRPEELEPGYEKLPSDLDRSARAMLRGRSDAYVSRTSGGKLSRYAAKQRKAKRKAAQAARKRNR